MNQYNIIPWSVHSNCQGAVGAKGVGWAGPHGQDLSHRQPGEGSEGSSPSPGHPSVTPLGTVGVADEAGHGTQHQGSDAGNS